MVGSIFNERNGNYLMVFHDQAADLFDDHVTPLGQFFAYLMVNRSVYFTVSVHIVRSCFSTWYVRIFDDYPSFSIVFRSQEQMTCLDVHGGLNLFELLEGQANGLFTKTPSSTAVISHM